MIYQKSLAKKISEVKLIHQTTLVNKGYLTLVNKSYLTSKVSEINLVSEVSKRYQVSEGKKS